ncbi:MAG: EFR1 family ferrodoxin [Ignavibacterium album]|uniref:EFR1 family ferrodoxin n=1 Tax=Ignavibacterium album TaxID=591197 RepID=UPI0026EF5E48|nr:EFR1 family ferrodoxin [Ignavibacterium album]MCX8105949.1 EFR1 family ferrodoxin [Ignavibacterium album]
MIAYKRIYIFYFSGTGNSKQVAGWISECASARSMDCQLYDISKTDLSQVEPLDPDALIIIISPIHGFNYPKITLDFIRRFPAGKNKIVLMNTRAGMKIGSFVTPGLTGIAFIVSSLILKLKGYKIVGQIPFDMPSNWISLHPALRENAVKYIHKKIYSRVKKHTAKIFSGKNDFWALRDLVQDILISPIAIAYYLVGRFALAKTFYASYKCDNCDVCIKQCPVKAIEKINNHPYWTFKCESCMKCMNSCSKRAIETAHGLFTITVLLNSTLSALILTPFLQENILNDSIRYITVNLLFLALLWVFYKAQHLLVSKNFLGKVITLTSLTYYKFWGRYKSIPDYKWKE